MGKALFLLHFALSLLVSAEYSPPDRYFINCGSDSTVSFGGRDFVGDSNHGSLDFSVLPETAASVKDTNSSTSISLYQTARSSGKLFSYVFNLAETGTYFLRLHFFVFPTAPASTSDVSFDVIASNFSLLSNFSFQGRSNSPVIEEFLLTLEAGELKIHFVPSNIPSLVFINALELFLAPPNFTSYEAFHVDSHGSRGTYRGLQSQALHTIYRLNNGGSEVNGSEDSLWRTWLPDDKYLLSSKSAKNCDRRPGMPNYQGNASIYIAPDEVYKTCKTLIQESNISNITWRFNVSKSTGHIVRVHFCDIVGDSLGSVKVFGLYIYSRFVVLIEPYQIYSDLAAPFYLDYVVDSDESGFMNISVGSNQTSPTKTAFLNGLEIMELRPRSSRVFSDSEPRNKRRKFVLFGSVIGAGILVFLAVLLLLFLKRRKTRAVGSVDLPERIASSGAFQSLNLKLKIPLAEILDATNNFDTRLIIGEGGFGRVYKGTLRGGVKVAVKRSDPKHGQGLPEFQREILVLSKIRHRHLVSLIGYCDERPEMILVYEFLERGALRDHLYDSNAHSRAISARSKLSWMQRLQICVGSARGLYYLHTGPAGGILHRDVKSTNILLNEHYEAKVADFGLSKSSLPDPDHSSTGFKGSMGYFDPDYFRCFKFSDKSDVYSFGVVLLEVLCARPAIIKSTRREEVSLAEWGMHWQTKGMLEEIMDPVLVGDAAPASLKKFGETAEKCLKATAVERPSMRDVLWDLEYALELHQTSVLREPQGDSTTDGALRLTLPSAHRLPSFSASADKAEVLSITMTDEGLSESVSEDFPLVRT